eukprot:g63787.t1
MALVLAVIKAVRQTRHSYGQHLQKHPEHGILLLLCCAVPGQEVAAGSVLCPYTLLSDCLLTLRFHTRLPALAVHDSTEHAMAALAALGADCQLPAAARVGLLQVHVDQTVQLVCPLLLSPELQAEMEMLENRVSKLGQKIKTLQARMANTDKYAKVKPEVQAKDAADLEAWLADWKLKQDSLERLHKLWRSPASSSQVDAGEMGRYTLKKGLLSPT